jgi:alkylhydroperoxidase family enzyme
MNFVALAGLIDISQKLILQSNSQSFISSNFNPSYTEAKMRLKYTPDPPLFSDPSEQAFLNKLIKDRGHLGLGPLYRTLLISPTFARGFLQFMTAVRYRSTLPADVMELAMCRVGALNGAAFEWMHHMPLLKKAGISEEGIETVRTAEVGRKGRDGEGGLSGRMWNVMRYVDAMTKDVRVSDEVFEAVENELDDERQVVELSASLPCFCLRESYLRLHRIFRPLTSFFPKANEAQRSSDGMRLQRCLTLFDSLGCGRNERRRSWQSEIIVWP